MISTFVSHAVQWRVWPALRLGGLGRGERAAVEDGRMESRAARAAGDHQIQIFGKVLRLETAVSGTPRPL